ncbi:hypothetical protein [Flavobacterium aestivum]|uniref:hypothetical protein n=1 Tax=Flavobacterium aestivum TaxID=3003257 RepID=UPI0022856741|nr:hypothetical protein [Flavobacterium aestivum]
MEYRIKEKHNLKLPVYLSISFKTKIDAENHLRQLPVKQDTVYSVVYGTYYSSTGGFAESKE